MLSAIETFLAQVVAPGEPRYYATNYMETPYALRAQKINLPWKVLTSEQLRSHQLATTPTLSSCGIYVHLPTLAIIVNCEDNGSFVIRKNEYELLDIIMRSQVNRDVHSQQTQQSQQLIIDPDVTSSTFNAGEEAPPVGGKDFVTPEILLKELAFLEEDYKFSIPSEARFSKLSDRNDEHKFVDGKGLVLQYMRPMPLLPVYIGSLDRGKDHIEPFNYNEKYYRTDMIASKKKLVFYQKFYTSIRIVDVVVVPLDDYRTPLPKLEAAIDHVLGVETALRLQNEYEAVGADDLVTKIMHYYSQVYHSNINSGERRQAESPTPPSPGSFIDSPPAENVSTPSRNKVLSQSLKKVVLFDDLRTGEGEIHVPTVKSRISKLTKSIRLFRDRDIDLSSDSSNEGDYSPVLIESADILNILSSSEKHIPTSSLTKEKDYKNTYSAERAAQRMNIRGLIHEDNKENSSNKAGVAPRESVVEVEQSKIISSSQSQSQSELQLHPKASQAQKRGHSEVINSTSSTEGSKGKSSVKGKSSSDGSEHSNLQSNEIPNVFSPDINLSQAVEMLVNKFVKEEEDEHQNSGAVSKARKTRGKFVGSPRAKRKLRKQK